jgi:hypothetical protein
MKTTGWVALSLGAALLVTACDDDDASGPKTATALAQREIASRTTETATPIEMNLRVISDADTDDFSQPVPVD